MGGMMGGPMMGLMMAGGGLVLLLVVSVLVPGVVALAKYVRGQK